MDLSTYSTTQLVAAFNLATGRDIKKFENRKIAEQRVACLFQNGPLDLDTVLGLAGDQQQPTPSVTKEPAVAKKPHAADTAAAAIVAGAVSFNVHMRLAPSKKINEPAETLLKAARIGAELEEQYTSKRAMVYAIDASGASALVPAEVVAAALDEEETAVLVDCGQNDGQAGATLIADEELTEDEVPGFLRRGRVSDIVSQVVPEAAPAKPARTRKEKPAKAEGASTRARRDLGATISEVVANPKKAGSKSHARFELYKAGMTLQGFIDACFKAGYPESEAKADISWDDRKGFIKIGPAA